MRLLIDLQGAQTSGSRNRGIGRYSMALTRELATLAPAHGHSVHVLLNNAFAPALVELRSELRHLLAPDTIHVWQPVPESAVSLGKPAQGLASAIIREGVIATIEPDAVLVTSLFEGLGDAAVTTVKGREDAPLTAVILYDLIPLIQSETYLGNSGVRRWYNGRLQELRRADLLLSISESARGEGIDHLSLLPEDIVAISTAADDVFRPQVMATDRLVRLRTRYGLRDRFVMYTGGIDHRKNVEGLIRAYALLPPDVRSGTTLAIVCAASEEQRLSLEDAGREQGLLEGELSVTGFVPEDELVALYAHCTLFVFPSLHEGFGLPALEAMACGAPVIGSDRSSIPEVIGDARALFDPADDAAIAAKMEEALTQPEFLAWLRGRAAGQASLFSWRKTAEAALEAIMAKLAAQPAPPPRARRSSARSRLAMVSPVPPQRSGIAQYTAELLPDLARYYDIDTVVEDDGADRYELEGVGERLSPEEFATHGARYDRVIYQLGNSSFHAHMPELMCRFPGTVVLHDLWLSGMTRWKEMDGHTAHYWTSRLRDGHGFAAALERLQARGPLAEGAVQRRYACHIDAVRLSTNVIVHSDYARAELEAAYGPEAAARVHVIPFLRRRRPPQDRAAVRKRLGFAPDDFVVCSFGGVSAPKMHDILLQGWFGSLLARDRLCRLVIVGGMDGAPFSQRVQGMIAKSEGGERVTVTGYASDTLYGDYLAAADLGVQLRGLTNGETSGAVMDCLAAGLPLIMSSGAAFSETSADMAWRLPEQFAAGELAHALEALRGDAELRRTLGQRARAHMTQTASPRLIAARYRDVLEATPRGTLAVRATVVRSILARLPDLRRAQADEIGLSVARNLPLPTLRRRLLVDVTGLDRPRIDANADTGSDFEETAELVRTLMERPVMPFVTWPVAVKQRMTVLSQDYAYRLLGGVDSGQPDEVTVARQGDAFVALFLAQHEEAGQLQIWEQVRSWCIPIVVLCTDRMLDRAERRVGGLNDLLDRVAKHADVVVIDSMASSTRLEALLDETHTLRQDTLRIAARTEIGQSVQASINVALDMVAGRSTAALGLARTAPQERLIARAGGPLVTPGVGLLLDGSIYTTQEKGQLITSASKLPLAAGSYQVQFYMTSIKPAGCHVEILAGQDRTVIARQNLDKAAIPGHPAVTLMFVLRQPIDDVDIRVCVGRESKVRFERYELRRLYA